MKECVESQVQFTCYVTFPQGDINKHLVTQVRCQSQTTATITPKSPVASLRYWAHYKNTGEGLGQEHDDNYPTLHLYYSNCIHPKFDLVMMRTSEELYYGMSLTSFFSALVLPLSLAIGVPRGRLNQKSSVMVMCPPSPPDCEYQYLHVITISSFPCFVLFCFLK